MTTPEEERLKMEHEAALETLLAVQEECMRLERENKALRKERDEWKAAVRGTTVSWCVQRTA
jgi:SMC interacting uncharacterized protein involved in chromosome segregation